MGGSVRIRRAGIGTVYTRIISSIKASEGEMIWTISLLCVAIVIGISMIAVSLALLIHFLDM
jgi:hypothetical protein